MILKIVHRQPAVSLGVRSPQLYSLVVLQAGGGDDVLGGMTGSGENHVSVAGQLLHDLLGLQVPDIDQAVLAARHDPLAAGDGEVGEDAILFILVTRVGLQTLALAERKSYYAGPMRVHQSGSLTLE